MLPAAPVQHLRSAAGLPHPQELPRAHEHPHQRAAVQVPRLQRRLQLRVKHVRAHQDDAQGHPEEEVILRNRISKPTCWSEISFYLSATKSFSVFAIQSFQSFLILFVGYQSFLLFCQNTRTQSFSYF